MNRYSDHLVCLIIFAAVIQLGATTCGCSGPNASVASFADNVYQGFLFDSIVVWKFNLLDGPDGYNIKIFDGQLISDVWKDGPQVVDAAFHVITDMRSIYYLIHENNYYIFNSEKELLSSGKLAFIIRGVHGVDSIEAAINRGGHQITFLTKSGFLVDCNYSESHISCDNKTSGNRFGDVKAMVRLEGGKEIAFKSGSFCVSKSIFDEKSLYSCSPSSCYPDQLGCDHGKTWNMMHLTLCLVLGISIPLLLVSCICFCEQLGNPEVEGRPRRFNRFRRTKRIYRIKNHEDINESAEGNMVRDWNGDDRNFEIQNDHVMTTQTMSNPKKERSKSKKLRVLVKLPKGVVSSMTSDAQERKNQPKLFTSNQ